MPVQFEPTNSFCYHFARYQVLPAILSDPEVQSGNPFRLIDFVKDLVDRLLTSEQQSASYPRAQTGKPLTVIKTIKWYVPFIAKNTNQLVSLGNGIYRIPVVTDIDESDVEDAALQDGELEASESEGYIYAFTFPALIQQQGVYPIKIGMTVNDIEQRVMNQCRGSAMFENPRILAHWKVNRVGFVESAIHKTLAARGKWREKVPGTEWFDTSTEEIKSIIEFIGALRQ